jgi:hypothetical protein
MNVRVFAQRLDQMEQGKQNARGVRCRRDFHQIHPVREQAVAVEREPLAGVGASVLIDPVEGCLILRVRRNRLCLQGDSASCVPFAEGFSQYPRNSARSAALNAAIC